MENISLDEKCRLLASCCAVVISTPIKGRDLMILSMSVRLHVHVFLILRSDNGQVRMFG